MGGAVWAGFQRNKMGILLLNYYAHLELLRLQDLGSAKLV